MKPPRYPNVRRRRELNMRVRGLENFRLTEASFRRLGSRKAFASVHLRTYEVTFQVRQIPPSQRHSYLAMRVNRWIERLRLRYPRVTIRVRDGQSGRANSWSLPASLEVSCSPQEILKLAAEPAVQSVYVTRVAGYRRRRSPATQLTWYCVRALVVIRVERLTAGLQTYRLPKIVSFWFALLRSKMLRNASSSSGRIMRRHT